MRYQLFIPKTGPALAAAAATIAMSSARAIYDELCGYTLGRADSRFIHQHVVDAFAAQTADEHTKPISLAFALIGLYLHVEKQFSGRQVQRVHMMLARRKRSWPVFALPRDRGAITVAEVMATPAGAGRDHAIDIWCASVWGAFQGSQQTIANLLRTDGIV